MEETAALKILVVDDEKISRDYVRDLINEFAPNAVVIEAASAKAALMAMDDFEPDIVFLDVKMPEIDGFKFLELISYRTFELIFITAHSHYAIQAIKQGASDYILKPIKKSEFKESLSKAVAKLAMSMKMDGKQDDYLDRKLIVTQQKGVKGIKFREIIYLKADNSYTTLFLVNNQKITTTKPIHKFEMQLNPAWFFRVHKSYMINLHHFCEYVSGENSYALMSDKTRILISRYRLSAFLKAVKVQS